MELEKEVFFDWSLSEDLGPTLSLAESALLKRTVRREVIVIGIKQGWVRISRFILTVVVSFFAWLGIRLGTVPAGTSFTFSHRLDATIGIPLLLEAFDIGWSIFDYPATWLIPFFHHLHEVLEVVALTVKVPRLFTNVTFTNWSPTLTTLLTKRETMEIPWW